MYFGGMLNTGGETAFSGAKFRCCSVGCRGIQVLCTYRIVHAGSVTVCTELWGIKLRTERPSYIFLLDQPWLF